MKYNDAEIKENDINQNVINPGISDAGAGLQDAGTGLHDAGSAETRPTILAKYPNKVLSLEYKDGRRAPLDRMALLASRITGDVEYESQTMDYLYKDRVRISITSRCNCRCLHCYEGDEDGKMTGTLSLSQIGRILDECKGIGIRKVELTGGEPLMHPEFTDILRLIKSKGMSLITISTNGMLITDSLLGLIRELGMNPLFRISFDGLGTHDRFRGVPGMEEIVTKKMLLVKEAGFRICCNINVNRITAPKLIDTARYAAKTFEADLFLIKTSPSPRWEKACPGATLTYEEYFEVCLEAISADINEKWGVNVSMLHIPTVPADLNMKPVFDAWHSGLTCPMTKSLMSHCPKANYSLIIGHDGRVLPCEAFAGHSRMTDFLTGDDVDIFKRPLKDILTDSEYRKIYNVNLNDLTAAEAECRDCRWLYICKGGCRLLSLYKLDTVEFNHRSKPNCTFFRGGFAERFENLFENK